MTEKQVVKVNKKILIPLVVGFMLTFIFLTVMFLNRTSTEQTSIPITAINSQTDYSEKEIYLKSPTYKNSDLTAEFYDKDTNSLIASFELKSHKSVDEILKVGAGSQIVMYYDVDSSYLLKDVLKTPKFIDMKTGKEVDRDYRYVIWAEEIRQRDVCIKEGLSKNNTYTCIEYGKEDYVWADWISYNSKDIPQGIMRIGIQVDVQVNDYVDGIWDIGGLEIIKHAFWIASLEAGLDSWYKFETNAGDYVSAYFKNTTLHNTPTFISGHVNNAIRLDGVNQYAYNASGHRAISESKTYSVIGWFNVSSFGAGDTILDSGLAGSDTNFIGVNSSGVLGFAYYDGTSSFAATSNKGEFISANTWTHFVVMHYSNDTNIVWINGVRQTNGYSTISGEVQATSQATFNIGRAGNNNRFFRGQIDELAIYNRSLTQTEIDILYNSGRGCTYKLCDVPGLTNTLLYPPNTKNFTTSTNNFNGTVTTNSNALQIANVSLLINGSIVETNTSHYNGTYTFSRSLDNGKYNWTIESWGNDSTEYTTTTRTFSIDTTPRIKIISPKNQSYSDNNVLFVMYATQDIGKWIFNWNGTNTSARNNMPLACVGYAGCFEDNFTIEEGTHRLLVYANNSVSGVTGLNNSIYFSVDTTPNFTVNLPTNNSNHTTRSISFDIISTQDLSTLIINYNGTNRTISTSLGTFSWHGSLDIEDGNHELIIYGRNEDSGVLGIFDENWLFNVDATAPTINVSYPNETIALHKINTNLSVNWTATDTHLSTCWFEWNGVNRTVTCGDNSAWLNITNGTAKSLRFWANDTFGNRANQLVTWNYRLLEYSQSYDSFILEGLSTTFSINLVTDGTNINLAYLSYNGTNSVGTITNHGSNNFTLSKTLTAPTVSTATNVSFFWNITQSTFTASTSALQQQITNFAIDNCAVNKIPIFNFTIRDEANQKILNATSNNTIGKVDIQIYGFGTTTLITEYSTSYSQINPFRVCINSTLTTGQQYSVYGLIEYQGRIIYQPEFYNIQNDTLSLSHLNRNISLYDLKNASAQVFKLIVKDSSFLAVENALIEVQRKYIDEGTYKIVELPKTDIKGETTASLVINDVIYKFIIKKYGEVISTFTDVKAICQTPLVSPCVIDFNAASTGITVPDFETKGNLNFTITYNPTSRIVESQFVVIDGVPALVLLEVIREDALGSAVCTDSITSTSGTLSCVVPASFGNSTVRANLYTDGTFQSFGQVKLGQTPNDIYGPVLVVLALFIMLTLIGAGMSDNPIFTIFFFMLGVIMLFALNLVTNVGLIGASSTFLWLAIAIIILVIKGGRRS